MQIEEDVNLPMLMAEVDNILSDDLHNSSHLWTAEFYNEIVNYYSFKIFFSFEHAYVQAMFSKHIWPILLGMVSGCKQMFYLVDTPQKVDKIH